MKRIMISVLILLIATSLFAETKTSMLQLQGAYGEAMNMSINPIAAQTESFLSGMPFNIEEKFVQYNANSDGRAIATWNVLSNTKFNIYVKADDMAPVDQKNYNPSVSLSYILTFSYDLSYPGAVFDGEGSFSITSGPNDHSWEKTSPTTEISVVDETYGNNGNGTFYKINLFGDTTLFGSKLGAGEGYTGSIDGRVFFKFTQASSTALSDNAGDYPAGDYKATVVFFIEGVDV